METFDLFSQSIPIISSQTLQNLITSLLGGSLGGIGSVFAGHPLDTIKVRMQMLNLRLVQCSRAMLAKEGVGSFFRGITSPLITAPLAASLYMATYDSCRLVQGIGFHEQMSLYEAAVAGTVAGGAYCLIGTPMELVKCRLQMEIVPKNGQPTKVRHMLANIFKEEGIRGLYRGNLAYLLREAPGSGVYFASYEGAKMSLNKWLGEREVNPLIAGGFAGVCYTVLSYPFDVIKTRLQCESRGKYPDHKWIRDGGIISCAKLMWRSEGMNTFWRGLSPSVARSMLTESIHFFMYEKTKKYFLEEKIN